MNKHTLKAVRARKTVVPPVQTPQDEVIPDPDVPITAPVDDVYEPDTEAPDVTD